jgi:anti-anti-sigma regulatory factor
MTRAARLFLVPPHVAAETRSLVQAEVLESGRIAVIAPVGGLCGPQAPAVRALLRGAGGYQRLVVLDLINVPLIDDALVDVVVGGAARCAAAGTSFVVANAQDQPWEVLRRARLAGVVRVHRRSDQPPPELVQMLAPMTTASRRLVDAALGAEEALTSAGTPAAAR